MIGIVQKRLNRIIESVKQGQVLVEHGNFSKRRSIIRSEKAIVWMERYFNLIGDHMPDKNQIHLPSWESQKSIYTRYVDDMADQGIVTDEVIALSSFYRIWSTHVNHVSIPEVSHCFFHCYMYSTACIGL